MRLTTVLLIATMMQVSAASYAQRLSFQKKNVTLDKVFSEIRKQTGYSIFLFADLKGSERTNADFKDTPLEAVLDKLLKGRDLSYTIDEKTIIVKKKESSLTDITRGLVRHLFQSINVHGHVIDENGKGLAGASVKVRSENKSVITNEQGDFTLTGLNENSILEIAYVGYKVLSVKASDDLSFLKMERDDTKLEELVVKGYYSTTKKLNTGNVSSVKGEDLERQPQTNAMQSLQGMVPGLFIQQASGFAGAKTKVLLRGTNSFNSGTLPLYIIDGVPFNGNSVDAQMSAGYAIGNQPNGGTDALNAINPADIESIQVLKDADATAIYGSRGANGVILISTKKALAGKTKLNVNVYTGGSQVTHLLPTLSTPEYLALRRKAFANDNITPDASNAPDLTVWDQNQDTNYQKLIMGQTAHLTDATASISGGTKETTFLLSGTWHDQSSVLNGDFDYNRGSMHMKVNHTSPDGKLKIDFSTIYSADNNKMSSADNSSVISSFPNNYPLYNPNGTLYFGGNFSENPMGLLMSYYKTKANNLVLNSTISYTILSGLQIKANLGHTNVSLDQKMINPSAGTNPVYGDTGSGFYSRNETKSYLFEPQLDYNRQLGKGKLAATLGATYQYTYFNEPFFVIASDFASDALIENYGAASSIFINKQQDAEYKYASVFGRINYSFLDKYVFNATFRRDASSRFGPEKQIGDFGSLGAAWIFSDEDFMKGQKILSFGKLRGSYGTVGNDQIQNYAYLDTYSPLSAPYGSNAGYIPTGIANANFSWETTRKLEVGLELGFLNNALKFNAAWYRNRSSNLLADIPLTAQSGFASYTGNIHALVQNSGIELELNVTAVHTANFSWNSTLTYTANKNKLLEFPDLKASSYANTYVVGQPLSVIGVYQLTGFKNGVAEVLDANHDGTISTGLLDNGNGDFINAGTLDPKFFGGFSNNFKYKNWSLDVFFNFVKQKGYAINSFPGLLQNQYREVLNSQFTPSTLASSDSYNSYNNYYVNSTGILTDASYIRMRNISLSYSLPDAWVKKIKASSVRLYVSGQNLITITNYKGYDPETQIFTNPYALVYGIRLASAVLPPLKSITAGIQCSF